MKQTLTSLVTISIKHQQSKLKQMVNAYAFRYPEQLIRQKEQELDKNRERMDRSFQLEVNKKMERFSNYKTRLSTQHPKRRIEQATKD